MFGLLLYDRPELCLFFKQVQSLIWTEVDIELKNEDGILLDDRCRDVLPHPYLIPYRLS